MPGPCNSKKKKANNAKKQRRAALKQLEQNTSLSIPDTQKCDVNDDDITITAHVNFKLKDSDLNNLIDASTPETQSGPFDYPLPHTPGSLPEPCVVELDSGLRVKDVAAYMSSKFVPPPSYDDPWCAWFARQTILDLLNMLLPGDLALMVWHNKTRTTDRICPTCQRIYHLGDLLPDPISNSTNEGNSTLTSPPSPELFREQRLSGLCSSLCFILATYNHPELTSLTWGRSTDELDESTMQELRLPGTATETVGLGAVVWLTRWHDLGLEKMISVMHHVQTTVTEHVSTTVEVH